MEHNPFRVEVLSLASVLYSIYGSDEALAATTTEEATAKFQDWINEHGAHYYVTPAPNDPAILMNAILIAIEKKCHVLVMAKLATDQDDDDL